MEDWLTPWFDRAAALLAWLQETVLTWPVARQVAAGFLVLGISLLAAGRFRQWLGTHGERARWVVRVLSPALLPLFWLLLTWVALAIFRAYGQPFLVLDRLAGLLVAWVVIHLVAQFVRHPLWAALIVWTTWTIAALYILGWLDPIIAELATTNVPGTTELTLLTVVQAILLFVIVVAAAIYFTGLLEARIKTSRTLSPLAQVLFLKSVKFVLIAFAVVVAIASLGIDLTTLAVFGGVVGVGIGFGLQRVISNLISGVVLLVDNSIKPGDIIAVSGTYGWVTSLGGRYVSVVTRDGVEHLIPNETLITERVENWTHTHSQTRLKVDVSVHYGTDVRRAMALCIEAAAGTERVLADPEPKCLLLELGDNGIKLQTRFWIADAHNGVQNVKSDVLLGIWHSFKREGIEIPYPQRVLHLADPVLD